MDDIELKGMNGQGRRGKDRRPQASLEKLFDRVAPHSLDAEQSLLGSLLLDPAMFGDVATLISKGSQFYSQAHAAIFEAMRTLYDQTGGVDVVQLGELLRDKEILDLAGGEGYLLELASAAPSAAGAVRYARIVSNKSRLRRLIDAAGEILHEAYHAQAVTDDETDEVIDGAEQRIFEIASDRENAGPELLTELIQREFDRIEAMADGGGHVGVPTGFTDFDEMTTGLQPGELLILAARPSMGKTALALNLAEQIALGGRTPWSPKDDSAERRAVGVFSLEMSREALAQRLLSARSGIASEKLRSGEVKFNGWQKLQTAAAELYEAPIYIDDTPSLTVLQMRARARRMKERYDLQAIIIDYLQLLTAPHAARESRQVEVSTISRQIKALARELKLPIVFLAQLNRGAEQRERTRPRMSDLRESGSIEQDADVVMLLHREAYYHRGDPEWDPKSPEFNPDNEDKLNLSELILAKQRNGPTGTVHLIWDNSITRFKNRDHHHSASSGGYGGAGYGGSTGGGYAAPPPGPGAQAGGYGSPPAAVSTGGDTGYTGPTFQAHERSGPISDHRDGGGPDRGEAGGPLGLPGVDEDDEIAPF